ncbi:MAG: F0F1 ATP synthase subunit B [Candidatus Zixiibacteriota bacterium]|nr:MAG: F0F1 ATP synthase subunit B [candidate division Zixibacteria bacterium]
MDISIPQIITHAIGFLITLWILKKFAWGPLLAMIEERREKIAGEFQKIEDDKAQVDKLAEQYQAQLKDIDGERRARLAEAVNEGKQVADEIKRAAHADARKIAEKAKAELSMDVAKAKVQLKGDMVAMTIAAAEKIIREKLDDAKHRELIGNFIDNVEKA